MTSHEHEHNLQFVKTFISAGEPKLMQRLVLTEIGEAPKVEHYMDARQEYARFICTCGFIKDVATHSGKNRSKV